MNIEKLENKWEEVKGQVKEKWGKLTKDDMLVIKGNKQQLRARLRERYGYTDTKAANEIATFMRDCNCEDVKTDRKSVNNKQQQRS